MIRRRILLLLLMQKRKKKRIEVLKQANKKRAEQTKEKVYQAVKALEDRGELISVRKVAREAGVSMNTARKYLKEIHNL